MFGKAVIAGMFIALGCMVNLKVGGYLGAFLFSFGLLSVVLYAVPLYTGRAGFCSTSEDLKRLPLMLLGNVVGTTILAGCAHGCFPDMVEAAQKIVQVRVTSPLYAGFFASVLCGFIMTTIVQFARKQPEGGEPRNFLILILGIPLFILSGYWHSIADAFYYGVAGRFDISMLWVYPTTVVGNYLGCNAYNLLVHRSVFYRNV